MHLGTLINTFLFGKFVGKDEYDNSYYRSYKNKYTKEKRWVIYKGIKEPSKIPPQWKLWLNFTSEHIPNESQSEKYFWQKHYLPNYTGTSKKFNPRLKKSNNKIKIWNANEN
jgi:NADH:ubiquinone oxidoreductase subunit